MRELGLASIYLAFFAILFAAIWNARAVVRLLRVKKDHKGRALTEVPDLRPARLAMIFTAVCLFTAGAALMHCFWNHRFDIEYVHHSSDLKLVRPFLIASFWNGQEGTFMLWCFYLSLWGLLVLGKRAVLATLFPLPEPKTENLKPKTIDVTTLPLREPFVTAVHNWCLVGMMLLLLVRSPFHYVGPQQKWEALMDLVKMGGSAHMKALPKDPKAFFARHGIEIEKSPDGMPEPKFVETKGQEIGRLAGFTGKPEPIIQPHDGRGLNELLQNPWMCIHPPIMFIGYSALALPFMFALAGLIKRDYQGWIHEAFPFLMFPWAFLGVGLTLGGAWAYGVLGWHGYWAWDPVENASLFPFLTATALIHGMVIQRRKGGGKGGNDNGGNDKGSSGGNTGDASRGGNAGGGEVGTFGRANFSLAILAHLLVLYGTFLTRSGILGDASVHSFTSEGNELFWTLVLVGGVTVMVSYGITPLIPMLGVLFLITQNGFATKLAKGELPAGTDVHELSVQAGTGILIGLLAAVAVWYLLYRVVTGRNPSRRLILFGLLGDRWKSIQSHASYEDTASRDFFVFIGVIALVASAACVTLGTSSPIVMTLLQWSPSQIKRISEGVVQKQFYDVAHVPIGITMLLAMALWRYFPWNGGGSGRLRRDLPKHLFVALLLTTALRAYLTWSGAETKARVVVSNLQWVIIACAFFTLVANFDLLTARLRLRTRLSKATIRGIIGLLIGIAIGALGGSVISLGFGMDYSAMYAGIAVAGMIGLTLGVISGLETWRSGPFVAHMGVAVLFVGVIISSAYEKTEMLSLPKGKTVNVFGGDYQAQLVGDTVNPRPGDKRYLWKRDQLAIKCWPNHGATRREFMAYPIVSLNNSSEMINVPFIRKQALVDWYWAANMNKDPVHAMIDGERLLDTISKVKDAKDDRPVARLSPSDPVSFDLLPEITFTLTGYQFFRDQASEDNFPIALLLDMERHERKGKRTHTPLVARVVLHPGDAVFSVTPEPVTIPGSDYCLFVDDQMDSRDKSRTLWSLRITGGTQWFKNEEDYGVTTSENAKEFPALAGWKFRLNDRILPEGMTEGKIDENSFIRLQMEATHEGKKFELQPGLAVDPSARQIRVPVPGTEYVMALEKVRPDARKYLVSLLRDDWKPYWVVEVTHKPLINFVWLGVGVMVLGGLMTMKHRMAGSVTTALE